LFFVFFLQKFRKKIDIPRQVCQFYSPVSAYIAGVHVKFIDYDKYMPGKKMN